MPTYIEYSIEDGTTVLVESDGNTRISRGESDTVIRSGKKFTDALSSIRGSFRALIAEMDALKVEEAEVKFGIKTIGEAGVFAVGKVGGEINYEVTLKWKKRDKNTKPESN